MRVTIEEDGKNIELFSNIGSTPEFVEQIYRAMLLFGHSKRVIDETFLEIINENIAKL